MAQANWKLSLEYTFSEDDFPPETIVIARNGSWNSASPLGGKASPLQEHIAIEMSFVIEMLLASGHCSPIDSDFQKCAEVFSER